MQTNDKRKVWSIIFGIMRGEGGRERNQQAMWQSDAFSRVRAKDHWNVDQQRARKMKTSRENMLSWGMLMRPEEKPRR